MHRLLAALVPALLVLARVEAAPRAYDPGYTLERGWTHVVVRPDGSYVESLDYVTRIDATQGIEPSGTDRIYFISSLDKVKSVEAWSIDPQGRQTRVSPDMIRTQDEASEEGDTEFSDLKSKVVIYPNVQVGSRLRYTARIDHHTTIFPGYFGMTFTPGTAFRSEDWQLTVDVPAGMKLSLDVRGIEGGLVGAGGGLDHYRFRFTNATARPLEEGGVANAQESPHISLSTYADPVALGRAYQAASRPMAVVTPAIRDLSATVTRGLATDGEKLRALHHWVAQNIRYVFVGLGGGRWIPHKADEVLSKRYGDCKDHAILLEALLSAAGIPSSAALVNLGDAYELYRVGAQAAINHVITYVPGLDLYVDSTNSFASHGSLSFSVMDKPTILTALGRIGHTPTMQAAQNGLSSTQDIRIQADGRIEGRSGLQATGTLEQTLRSNRFQVQGEDEAKVVKDLLSRFREPGIGHLEHADPEALGEPFWEKTEFSLEPLSNFPGPGALAVPVGLGPGFLAGISANPPDPERQSPWRCQSRTVDETTVLHFPAAVEISHVPPGTALQDGAYLYESSYVREGRDITVRRRLVEQHPGSVCGKADHEARLRFAAALRRDLRAQIIYY